MIMLSHLQIITKVNTNDKKTAFDCCLKLYKLNVHPDTDSLCVIIQPSPLLLLFNGFFRILLVVLLRNAQLPLFHKGFLIVPVLGGCPADGACT